MKNQHMQDAWRYARQIVNGEIKSAKYVFKACRYALAIKKLQKRKYYKWYFDDSLAVDMISFMEFMPHVKGHLARKPIKLEPFQKFIISQLYGWRSKENSIVRKYLVGLLELARKNGKSILTSGFCLEELIFGDDGAEVYSIATKADQAKLVWGMARDQISIMEPALKKHYKTVYSCISCPSKMSNFKFLGRDSRSEDGANASLVIVDEAAAVTDRNIIEVMISSMGSRLSPLIVYITTAQFTRDTKYFEERQYLMSVLDGHVKDDRIFGMIYALDPNIHDYTNEDDWIIANPNLDVSISREFIQQQVTKSMTVPAMRNEILIKHFNIFTSTSSSWIPPHKWDDCKGEVIREGEMYLSWDLAKTRDLSCVSRMWLGEGKYYVDYMCFIPEVILRELPPYLAELYKKGIDDNVLKVTRGEVVDHEEIFNYIKKSVKEYDCFGIGGDPYNANMLFNRIESELNLECVNILQDIRRLSPASKEVERMVYEKRIVHSGYPFINWQINNAECYEDVNENIKIRKGDDQRMKIDAVIATICCVSMCAGRAEENRVLEVFTV